MENLILVDMPVNNDWELKQGIEEVTQSKWKIKYKEGRLSCSKVKRLSNFIYYPLYILLSSSKVKKIVAWQQFYGLMYCFYNRILKTNKSVDVTVMTFIYKEKRGFIGKLYRAFISFCVHSHNLKNIIVFSRSEVDYYSFIFPSIKNKFIFFPLSIEPIDTMRFGSVKDLQAQNYIFTAGSSNRDYDFLISALENTAYNVKIACKGLKYKHHSSNIEILDVFSDKMLEYLFNSRIVVIPLKDLDISSGQLMILQAMQLGKPIIVSNNKGVYDYIDDGETGFIINNEKDILIDKIEALYKDDKFYELISQNQKKRFIERFSLLNLGRKIGEIV